MASLYEINRKILSIGQVNPDTGEYEVDEEALKALVMEREQKIEGIILWIKNLKAENVALKAEEAILAARRKVNEHLIERLEKYVQEALGGEKFKTSKCSVSYRTSTSVIVDEEHLAKKYMKVSYSPDKVSLRELLKAGKKIRGAALETKTSMTIK